MYCRYGLRVSSCLVFFFKQKTAYELRISDWSSDVCSSDLTASPQGGSFGVERQHRNLVKRHRHMMHTDLAQHRAMACAVGDMPGAAEADDRHPRRDRGPGPGRRILQREVERRERKSSVYGKRVRSSVDSGWCGYLTKK